MDHELEGLARIYRDATTCEPERQEALAGLIAACCGPGADPDRAREARRWLAQVFEPEITGVARWAATGSDRHTREAFVNEALVLLLEPRPQAPARICSFQPHRPFRSWLRTVLRHCWVSERRTRRPEALTGREDTLTTPITRPAILRDQKWEQPFGEDDLRTLAGWDSRQRVELLSLAALWRKVPPPLWEEWLADYEELRGIDLPRPFPPEAFLRRVPDDHGPWAELLHFERANTLSVRWMRSRRRLAELNFVQEICDEWTP